jgi:hypothetical protein
MTVHLPRLPISLDPLIKEAKRRMRRRRLLLAAVLAGVAALAVGLTLTMPPGRQGKPGSSGAARSAQPAQPAQSAVPSQIVKAFPLHSMSGSDPLRFGTRVTSHFSGTRIFVNHRDGFALGNLLASHDGGIWYPLATSDGGRTWRIAGPIVDVAAAQGGVDVSTAGIVNTRTWFMCCGLNTVVDVTADAGKHWYIAGLPGEVVNVFPYDNPRARLIAVVRPFPVGSQRLLLYTSVNGRTWTYDPHHKLIY